MGVYLYHGTTEESAKIIEKEGFKKGTYFAKNFDSAFQMGGAFVFAVYFKESPTKYWEHISPRKISISRIAYQMKIDVKLLSYDKKVSKQMRRDEGMELCRKCEGHGELTYNDDGHNLYPGGSSVKNDRKIVICKKCKGTGNRK